ncbi:MAG: radical SAM protein [Deltaproteobacteria bacterium]|nr:radical SAM protein [Deltaproteobacteria bacterium]
MSVYLRLSIEDACNLRCTYCRPEHEVRLSEPAPVLAAGELEVLARAIDAVEPVYKLRLTGGEPLLRPDAVELTARLREALPDAELCLTTNGTLLAPLARPLAGAGLARINVSLDSADAKRYAALTRGGDLGATLAGIEAARSAGLERIKLNTVLLEHGNGDALADLLRLAARLDCEIRFIELMPIGVAAGLHREEFLSCDRAFERLASRFEPLGPLPPSSTARRSAFDVEGRRVEVGFISSVSAPFCDRCDRLRLDCRGRLYACLRRWDGLDLAGPMRAGGRDALPERIRRVLAAKCPPESDWPGRQMSAIGG